ncbi:proton-conducting transporter transmembrane domain-containing protein [Planctomicrobium piriforme]|uniref:NADH-quinone oxidoreductase subunit M n=1 Tax=Planctomicrobium piriforme TaxID=1576369 RepID=A0A1I3HPB7_9PLAN|nr:proton-conducting transporter membrane subunit [Planctomicrobium piriforme]SFI37429.1 NADH-quinone oxidoreductase subunit M [Planctomicrobium piriforme]
MNELHFPWLELAIGLPLLGSFWVRKLKSPETARIHCIVITLISFLMTVGAWIDFSQQSAPTEQDAWAKTLGPGFLEIDQLSAPLMPLTSLLLLLTAVTTLRTKLKRFSFAASLVRATVLLAAFACRDPWAVIALLTLSTILPWLELRSRGQPTRIFTLHMAVYIIAMVAGQTLVTVTPDHSTGEMIGIILLVLAVLIRSGMFPFHTWLPDLFQRATFGTALMFVAPMPGVYLATRLLLPVAPDWILRWVALISVFTAFYAAGLTLVQKESRRFYSYLFLSQSALVLVGLELATPIGLTGSLSLWLSIGLALGGFGLSLRCVEARLGPFSITEYRGLYEHMPSLAAFFLLTGLASVGFPGTFGFIGAELIVEGVVQVYPLVGMVVVICSALNGIAVLMAYLRIFTGTHHRTTISLKMLPRERISVLVLTVLIIGGGIWPQPGIASRFHAAMQIVNSRRNLSEPAEQAPDHAERAASPANARWPTWLTGKQSTDPSHPL